MPSSTPHTLFNVVTNMLRLNPKTILDVGIGYGKNGFLAREYLCSWKDEVFPEQWTLKVDGLEIFEPYTKLPWIESLYDNVIVADAYEYFKNNDVPNYDMIICTDVLEHMVKDQGLFVGKQLIEKSSKGCIINVPTGDWMNNKIVAENEAENHRAIWEDIDLKNLALQTNTKVELFQWTQNGRTGCLGVFRK